MTEQPIPEGSFEDTHEPIPSAVSLGRARVLVVGDVMLDRYWQGATQRISPEAPVPVLRVEQVHDTPGGAANVARNVAALGAQVKLLSVVGDDEQGRTLKALMAQVRVETDLRVDLSGSTTLKLRAVARQQQLLRIDFESQGVSAEVLLDLQRAFELHLSDCDVVVFSDYAKGCLSGVSAWIDLAQQAGKLVVVDPKGTDFSRYVGADVVTPNCAELAAVIGPWRDESELTHKAQALRVSLGWRALLLTRSEEGISWFDAQGVRHERTQAREVFDVSGAGDTVVAVLASLMATGLSGWACAQWANVAASVVVGKFGAATASLDELLGAGRARFPSSMLASGGVLTPPEFIQWVRHAQVQGKRVVMTNGVFDLLHPGHIAYLEQARALGDCLVVALNNDASVGRLKGAQRPVNTLDDRMALLAALRCVDAVTSFAEDTPADLIEQVLPDCLVKGGDYSPEQIAGAQVVTRHGGRVLVLDFLAGYSTSQVVNKIRQG